VFKPNPLLPLFEFPPTAFEIVFKIPPLLLLSVFGNPPPIAFVIVPKIPLLAPVLAAGYFPPNMLDNPDNPPSIDPTPPELELLVDPPVNPPNNPLNGFPPLLPPNKDWAWPNSASGPDFSYFPNNFLANPLML